MAVEALALAERKDARLWIVGGASGKGGGAEVDRIRDLIDDRGLTDRVEFVPAQPHHLLSTYTAICCGGI